MLMLLPSLTAFFVLLTATFWTLQLATGRLATRYWTGLGLAVLGAGAGIALLVELLRLPATPVRLLAAAGVILLAAAFVAIVLYRLFGFPTNRTYSLRALSRVFTAFASPVERFRLRTEDGVTIQAVRLIGPARRPKAVIVCHGGGRSKDIWANVATCELLAEQYDVFTFDWRGHQESGGYWTGDGASKYDLKAVVEHVRGLGYERIGVVGWSLGAWIALIAGATFHNFDALIAAAPPPATLREAALARSALGLMTRWWAWPLRALVSVMLNLRVHSYATEASLEPLIAGLAPIPLLLVCNEYDTAIGAPAARFQQLFDRAGDPKRLAVLPGRGHIYDWPNTHHYLNLVREWLAQTL
jgi:pimeloyl-ACP methyl ester carboxylesterase